MLRFPALPSAHFGFNLLMMVRKYYDDNEDDSDDDYEDEKLTIVAIAKVMILIISIFLMNLFAPLLFFIKLLINLLKSISLKNY